MGAIKHSGYGYSGFVAYRGMHIDTHCGYGRGGGSGGDFAGWAFTGVFIGIAFYVAYLIFT